MQWGRSVPNGLRHARTSSPQKGGDGNGNQRVVHRISFVSTYAAGKLASARGAPRPLPLTVEASEKATSCGRCEFGSAQAGGRL